MSVCLTCGKTLPEIAVANGDDYDSRKCAERAYGVTMAADLAHGRGRPSDDITRQRTLGGVAVARTRLQREAAARSLEAHARVARESRRIA